jgi:23S rRNA (guanosine2251-2'-O)-methyltransferase
VEEAGLSERALILYGRHPVLAALRSSSRRFEEIAVLNSGRGAGLDEIVRRARALGIKLTFRSREALTALAGTGHHQGVVAQVSAMEYVEVEDLLRVAEDRREAPFLLALDQLQDPQNLGSLLRSAEGAGVHGVILLRRNSVGLTGTVAKAAAGSLERLAVARVGNMAETLRQLRGRGLWVVGTVPAGGTPLWETDLTGPLVLVLGGEGRGIRPLVAQQCDRLTTIPMRGLLASLNAAVAGAVCLFEVVRQQRGKSAKNGGEEKTS